MVANPEKIKALLTMPEPSKLRDVYQLSGRVAALSHFISKLGEKVSFTRKQGGMC